MDTKTPRVCSRHCSQVSDLSNSTIQAKTVRPGQCCQALRFLLTPQRQRDWNSGSASARQGAVAGGCEQQMQCHKAAHSGSGLAIPCE